MIYVSDVMKNFVKMMDRIAPSNASVLINGESGIGKEVTARSLHEKSSRKNKPFVSINCGALRETLLESELFGHEKGSFTGAYTRKIGLAEIANSGTLYLKDVSELTAGTQAKLLRFLQEGEIYRVGGKDPIKIDVRLVTSTHIDLESLVAKEQFREDLYYRINTITLNIPPLRRRPEDVLPLMDHFLGEEKFLSEKAEQALTQYTWPGNIRELENTCERLKILVEKPLIEKDDLPQNILTNKIEDGDSPTYDPNVSLHDLEKAHILKSLKHFDNNKTKAAHALGITIKTLYNKLHMYGYFDEVTNENT